MMWSTEEIHDNSSKIRWLLKVQCDMDMSQLKDWCLLRGLKTKKQHQGSTLLLVRCFHWNTLLPRPFGRGIISDENDVIPVFKFILNLGLNLRPDSYVHSFLFREPGLLAIPQLLLNVLKYSRTRQAWELFQRLLTNWLQNQDVK